MGDDDFKLAFRREEDVDSMREFATWLRGGGMESLREMQQLANDVKNIRQATTSVVVKSLVTMFFVVIVWGVVEGIRKAMGR